MGVGKEKEVERASRNNAMAPRAQLPWGSQEPEQNVGHTVPGWWNGALERYLQ